MARSRVRHPLLNEIEKLIMEQAATLPSFRLQRVLNGIREIDDKLEMLAALMDTGTGVATAAVVAAAPAPAPVTQPAPAPAASPRGAGGSSRR